VHLSSTEKCYQRQGAHILCVACTWVSVHIALCCAHLGKCGNDWKCKLVYIYIYIYVYVLRICIESLCEYEAGEWDADRPVRLSM
jgi:hypothetical protein